MAVTTAGSPLKKMTHNGQPVKKWVHDGVQVYTAEFNAMTDATWTTQLGDGWGNAFVNNTSQKTIQFADNTYGYAHFYFPIDLSKYTKMTISCSHTCAYSQVGFGFSANDAISNAEADNFTIVRFFKGETSGSLTNQVYDLSNYNHKNAYFKMWMYDGSQAGGVTNFTITKLIFE